MLLIMQPIAFLERRSFCAFGEGLNTNPARTFMISSFDALKKDMTVDKPSTIQTTKKVWKGGRRCGKAINKRENLGANFRQPN